MENILKDINFPGHPDLLVGMETRDDAGIYRINQDQALIQTLDFLTPMVDDPFVFGQIAATNALNDVYAMGGRPLLAMNIVCYPQCEDIAVLRRIIEGGLSKVLEAGALLVGGHTVDDLEPKFGLAVSGMVHPERIISNSGARPGDSIFLTKPLGSGIIATAVKAEMADPAAYEEAVKWMTRLNRELPEIAGEIRVHAATDVTGFGLVGHLLELARASDVQVEIYSGRIPCIKGALDYAAWGLIPGAAYSNRDYLQSMVQVKGEIDANKHDLLFSPETAGGLLIAVSPGKAAELAARLSGFGSLCVPVGEVLGSGFGPLIISDK